MSNVFATLFILKIIKYNSSLLVNLGSGPLNNTVLPYTSFGFNNLLLNIENEY